MNKTAMLVALACCIGLNSAAVGQNTAAPAAPVKIGLVDMAKVFKEYDKFEDMRAALKAEMEAALAEAQGIANEAKKVQEELKLLKAGSQEFIKREADLARLHSEFETKRKLANAQYQRKEAEIFQDIYKDAQSVIKLYAEHFKYSLVLRFNSTAKTDGDNPRETANALNKLVIYHRPQDDITEAVIDYLDRQYVKTVKKPAPAAGGTVRQ